MTCRHKPGDPSCSKHPDHPDNPSNMRRRELEARTPDKEQYEVVQFQRIGAHVVMKVRYPNCARCAYEGNKVMVYLNVTEADILRWRVMDPHFADPKVKRDVREAPAPAARFPANDQGWQDALDYVALKPGSGTQVRGPSR